jgi:hypothetical protein
VEDGCIDETFLEDGASVVSGRKEFPLHAPMIDVMACIDCRPPPATMVVSELISTMVQGGSDAYSENPTLSTEVVERLERIFARFSTNHVDDANESGVRAAVMNLENVERWLVAINGQIGRGSEFREAARLMGWNNGNHKTPGDSAGDGDDKAGKAIMLPIGGSLSLEGFVQVYQDELKQGKFWGIAHDLAVLGEPLSDAGLFQSRYDRMYCSAGVRPLAVMDFLCSEPCPNEREPSDHLPVAASFSINAHQC